MSQTAFERAYERALKEGGTSAPATATTAAPAERVKAPRASRLEPDIHNVDTDDGFAAFAHGAADTITFGFLDEAGAWVDSSLPVWAGGNGKSYQENLKRNRAILGGFERDSGGAYLSGQLAGGFVPAFGWGGRAASAFRAGKSVSVGRMALAGGAQGALYGYGSADADDIFTTDRLGNAATMGAFGAAGGFILGTAIFQGARVAKAGFQRAVAFRAGRSPKLDINYKQIGSRAKATADDVAEDLTSHRQTKARATPADPVNASATTTTRKVNRITGKFADELEKGAIASGDEIATAPREKLFAKFANLSPAEAKVAAKKLTEAMESGDLTKDPHFRSILGLDLSEYGDEAELIPQIAEILTELGEEVLTKAGMGRRTMKSMEDELRARFGGAMSEDAIDQLVEQVKATRGSANTGSMIMTLAGVKFARVTKELMPDVLKGSPDARKVLAEELSTALRISAKGQFLLSEAGRNLGMVRHARSLLLREIDDGVELESKDVIQKRVSEAIAALDDDGLNELLSRVRDLSDLEEISRVLMNPEHAARVGLWYRFKNTFEAFIKSNTLTPMTAAVNFVGVPIHNWMRNSGARQLAALAAKAAGNEGEALILTMQHQAASQVRLHAHLEGLKATAARMKWEWLGSWKNIAGAISPKAAMKASASRQAMIARGYKPPPIREFDMKARLAVTDLKAFEQRLADRAARDAPFAHLVNAMERVGAAALNTLDALGTATAKLASGAIDDYGRALIMTKEVYAEMAGKATAEAIRKGIPEDELADYVSRRTEEWAQLPPEDILTAVEKRLVAGEDLSDTERMLLRRDYDAEKEAERVLFLDGPQTSVGRAGATMAKAADNLVGGFGQLKGILMPYIHTPTRILERGLASYTPWGHATKEVAEQLAKGGTEAAVERARMELGGMVIGIGMLAAASGMITVTNGGYQNSANLQGGPANRVNLPGGGYVEFGRLDPIAMSLALGGVVGQMFKASQEAGDKYGQDDAIAQAFAIGYAGIRDAVLEKSYMTGLSELVEAFTSNEEGSLERYFSKLYPDAATRTLPLSGASRQINETLAGRAIEATSAIDRLTKVIPGMGAYLPARIDPLGNEVDNRKMGLAVGLKDVDPVTAKLAELGVDITALKKADPRGFDLTAEELSELRRIRATEATNKHGQTMKEALAELFADPTFQALPDKQMVQDEVVAVMGDFNEPAREIFELRNQEYLANREAARSLKAYIADGLSQREAAQAARDEVVALGLPDPDRINQ